MQAKPRPSATHLDCDRTPLVLRYLREASHMLCGCMAILSQPWLFKHPEAGIMRSVSAHTSPVIDGPSQSA